MSTKHTPGWIWGNGWEVIDRAGTMYRGDDPDTIIEKYMDLQLVAGDEVIIPLRIDHYEPEYDGAPIRPEHRALIAAAPDLLAACEMEEDYQRALDSPDVEDALDEWSGTWGPDPDETTWDAFRAEMRRAAIAKAKP